MEEKREIVYSDIGSALRKQPYGAMVYIEGTSVIAVDSNGKVIARGIAGEDDSAVIQAAIDAKHNVLLSKGTFRISSSILINAYPRKLCGMGMNHTTLVYGGGDYAIRVLHSGTYARDCELHDFGIKFSADAIGGILWSAVKNSNLRNVYIDGAGYSVDVGFDCSGGTHGTWYNDITNLVVYRITNASNTGKGVYVRSEAGQSNDLTIVGGVFQSSNYNVYVAGGNGHKIIGSTFESGTVLNLYNAGLLSVIGCRLEGGHIQNESSYGCHLIGVRLSSVGIIGTHADKVTRIKDDATAYLPYIRTLRLSTPRLNGHIHFSDGYPTLQAAVDALEGGDVLFIMPGSYHESVSIPSLNRRTILGVGRVIIDGGESSALSLASSYGAYGWIENLTLRSTGGHGLYIGGRDCEGTLIRNVTIDAGVRGIYLYASGDQQGPTFENIVIKNTSSNAMYMHATTNEGGYRDTELRNVRVYNCVGGIALGRSFRTFIYDTHVYGLTGENKDALSLSSNNGSIVSGGIFVPSGTGVPIANPTGNYIQPGLMNNWGHTTESKGTATLLNTTTSIVVAHGCSATPTNITVTPGSIGNATKWYVDTIDATNFTIHVDQDPGEDITFYWRAEV